MALAPELTRVEATRLGTVISLRAHGDDGESGILALQIDGDRFVTSSDTHRLRRDVAEALAGLGPSLAGDAVVLAELSQCEGDDEAYDPSAVIANEEKSRRAEETLSSEDPPEEREEREESVRELGAAESIRDWESFTIHHRSNGTGMFAFLARTPWSLMWILGLGIAFMTWVARVRPSRRAERSLASLPALGWRTLVPLMLGAMVTSFVYMIVSADGLPIRHDSIRDLAVAQDFWIDGVGPGTHGSSISGLEHGRLWPAVLGLLRSAGADLGWINTLRDLSVAFAAALCALLAVRLHGQHAAWMAAIVAGILGPWIAVHPLLWNPALATLPLAAVFVLSSFLLERGGPWFALATGAVAGLAVQAHPINAFAIPLVAGVASLRGGTAFDSLLAVLSAFVTIGLIDRQWVLNWHALAEAGPLALAIAVGVPLAIGLGGLLRGRFDRLGAASRQQVFVYVTAGLLGLAIGGAALLVELSRRYYLAAVVPGLACFAGLLGARLLDAFSWSYRHVVAWLIAIGAAGSMGPGEFVGGHFLEDAEALAKELHARGIPRNRVGNVLQAPHRFVHSVALPLLYPDAPMALTSEDVEPVQVFFLGPGTVDVPPGWEQLPLAYTNAYIRSGPTPWLDRRAFETCGQRNGELWCKAVVDVGWFESERPWIERVRDMYISPWPDEIDRTTITQRLTVRTPGAGTRYLLIAPSWELSECTQFECVVTDNGEGDARSHIVEVTSHDAVEGRLILKQRETDSPSMMVGVVAELETVEPWIVASL
jgi:hypothetical protein